MWIDELLQSINYKDYYPQGKNTGSNQIITNCKFHEDTHASLSINLNTGAYFCHACSASGNFVT